MLAALCERSLPRVPSVFAHVPQQSLTDFLQWSAQRRVAVLVSPFRDIAVNIAIEHWLLNNAMFAPAAAAVSSAVGEPTRVVEPTTLQLLCFAYRSDPCVVIGRNQNPFLECNLDWWRGSRPSSGSPRVSVARRHSGGGTVYHDEGNLCFSFLTHRSTHSPARSNGALRAFLSLHAHERHVLGPDVGAETKAAIGSARAMLSRLPAGTQFTTTSRHDIFIDDTLKIAGSAMKLEPRAAYHHCTLLVSSDPSKIGACLGRGVEVPGTADGNPVAANLARYVGVSGPFQALETTSVPSVRSRVTSLLAHSTRGEGAAGLRSDERAALADSVLFDACHHIGPLWLRLAKGGAIGGASCAAGEAHRGDATNVAVLEPPTAEAAAEGGGAPDPWASIAAGAARHRTAEWVLGGSPRFVTELVVALRWTRLATGLRVPARLRIRTLFERQRAAHVVAAFQPGDEAAGPSSGAVVDDAAAALFCELFSTALTEAPAPFAAPPKGSEEAESSFVRNAAAAVVVQIASAAGRCTTLPDIDPADVEVVFVLAGEQALVQWVAAHRTPDLDLR